MKHTKRFNRNNIHKKKTHKKLHLKTKYDNYKIFTLEDINKYELTDILQKIFLKNEKFPLIGYFTNDSILKILHPKMTFFIFKSNLFIGIIFFKNMTYDFKKSFLGSKYINDNQLKSKSNINNYLVNWIFIYNDVDKNLFDNVCNRFRKINNLMNKNIIITTLKNFSVKQNHENDILYRFKYLFDYPTSYEYNKLINLGFNYNGYNILMHNDLMNIYSIKFINKNLSKDDFFPLYIISRQLKNAYSLDLTNIKKLLHTDGLISINNINRYSIDNTLLFYTNQLDNEIYSVYSSIPYNFNFVMNYITNDLGNSHIIKKYSYLYFALRNDLEMNVKSNFQSKDLDFFCEIIISYDKAINLLNIDGANLLLTIFPIQNYDTYLSIGFTNKKDFEEYIVNNEKKIPYGYYLRNYNFINKIFPLKNDTLYYVTPYLIFTFINQKLKCYVYKTIALIIFIEKIKDLFNNKEFINLNFLVRPQIFHESFNNFASRNVDVDDIYLKIRKLCSIIGKIYKKYVNLQINQIHGFCAIHPMIRLIEENNEIIPKLYNVNSNALISRSNNAEMSEWIYNIAIAPALYPNYKCERQELHYQPLNIE
jgi:hypothetical protein